MITFEIFIKLVIKRENEVITTINKNVNKE